MKATNNFFESKKAWSKLKDEILMSYLTPYLTKISRTGYPIIIADCFAGKGRFDDGQNGSPLIIAEAVEKFKAGSPKVRVNTIFVEKKYFKDLQKNLCSFTDCVLSDSDYEKWAVQFAQENRHQKVNLLLYVDPYGIKPIPFQHFREIHELNFNSVELLLNFNSFGFLREGCRLLGLQAPEADDDTEVYENDGANSVRRMDRIANGGYWQNILREYSSGGMNTKEAERQLCDCYAMELKTLFRHVVNIPIKQKEFHMPKYRIFFGTNSADGLLLVADKMSRTWKEFLERVRNGQQSLCEAFDFPDATTSETLEDAIWSLLAERHELKDLFVKLVEKFGIAYSESELTTRCKQMEKEKSIIVGRDPATTPTGKIAASWDYRKYKICLERGGQRQERLL